MSEDPFAFQVERLTERHRSRHPSATVAEVTLQRWLILRRRYCDPFDADLFDRIDATLQRMPAGIDAATDVGAHAQRDAATPRPTRRRYGRSAADRPVSRSA